MILTGVSIVDFSIFEFNTLSSLGEDEGIFVSQYGISNLISYYPPPGKYIVRCFIRDVFGSVTTYDTQVIYLFFYSLLSFSDLNDVNFQRKSACTSGMI